VGFLIYYWQLALIFIVIGLIIYFGFKFEEKQKIIQEEKRKQEEYRLQEIENERHAQEYCFKSMLEIVEESITLFETLPNNIETAENYLDQAEIDFKERAFAPFWDSIENAINQIGQFDENINKINNNFSSHKQLLTKYKGNSPPFPISNNSISKLTVGEKTSQRLRKIVRIAQRDFEFATIYEQRKTNKILVAGFNSFAQALERMTWQITDSIGNLQSSVDSMSNSLNSQLDNIHNQMDQIIITSQKYSDSNQRNQRKIIELAKESSEREKRALAMLDNIQYRREPSIFNK
jgi:hypothetical protein